MTSCTTSTTFKCLSCYQPVLAGDGCPCAATSQFNPNIPPRIPKSVADAIYNCNRCNPTPYTFYKCSCDVGFAARRVVVIPPLQLPLSPIPEEEVEDGTQHFSDIFTFDDEGNGAPNSPEHATNSYQEKPATSLSSVSINPEDLPADLVSRYQAIDKIFQDAKEKK